MSEGAPDSTAGRARPRIVDEAIDVDALCAEVASSSAGAIMTFAGVVRDKNLGRQVTAIDYHAYRPMAEREALKLEQEIKERWPGVDVLIVHRLGRVEIGETSVLIALSSAHRVEGFEALRYAIDTLKLRLPIWKREIYTDGEAWLEGS